MALSDALATAERLGAAPMATELAAFARRSRLRPEEGGPPVRGRRPPEGEDGEPDPAAAFGLTPREVDVLGLLIEGRTDRQIAEALFISPHTVGIHVSRILGKLGVTSRTEAASVAYRLRAASGPRADGVRSAR
jgi:DNA-binding NarL/FixJ family response regulator